MRFFFISLAALVAVSMPAAAQEQRAAVTATQAAALAGTWKFERKDWTVIYEVASASPNGQVVGRGSSKRNGQTWPFELANSRSAASVHARIEGTEFVVEWPNFATGQVGITTKCPLPTKGAATMSCQYRTSPSPTAAWQPIVFTRQ